MGADSLVNVERWARWTGQHGEGVKRRRQMRILLAEYDRMKAVLEEIREAADDPGSSHEQLLAELRRLVERDEELSCVEIRERQRGRLIREVADAAGHVAEYPGQGLAEHVAHLRVLASRPGPAVTAEARHRAAMEAWEVYRETVPMNLAPLELWESVVDAVAMEFGVSVPASPADDGSRT